MSQPTTRFSTVEEVAAVLRVSKMSVYRLTESGELYAFRVGRSIRIPTKAVWEYLGENILGGEPTTVPIPQIAPHVRALPPTRKDPK